MQNDENHIKIRENIEQLLNAGISIEEVSQQLKLPLGSRYIKNSAKWYRFCIVAKRNQKKAIEKDPNLYSKAGKIAQQKHPWIGCEMGKKYGRMLGKSRANQLRGNSAYFSMMAKRLQKIYPDHSRKNMLKAHQTMKEKGTFEKHQKDATLKCMEKHPDQLKKMSKRAHELYPLALLALESRRRNYPYKFMDCEFDSDSERKLCEIFVNNGLISKPVEGQNVHFRLNRHHVDFFLMNKIFVEFHPPRKFGRNAGETVKSYHDHKRKLLDDNGYAEYPLMIIDRLVRIEHKIKKIKKLLALEINE